MKLIFESYMIVGCHTYEDLSVVTENLANLNNLSNSTQEGHH